jgi:hypothetical protein
MHAGEGRHERSIRGCRQTSAAGESTQPTSRSLPVTTQRSEKGGRFRDVCPGLAVLINRAASGFDQVLREEALMLIAAMDRHYLTDVASTVG